MNLNEILNHASLKAAAPVVRAGAGQVDSRTVRWVHSSEVLDIGPLLQGGELLLSGGTALTGVPAERQTSYIRELAACGVAALAIETGRELPQIPSGVVQAAGELGLPLIELRRVVPFVDITEAINSVLVSDSVSTLQRADALSHILAAELANGADLRKLLEVIASTLAGSVSLLVPGTLSDDLLGIGGGAGALEESELSVDIDIDIALRGMTAATLRIQLTNPLQVSFARSAGERAADVLALALLQHRPPTLGDLAGVELIRAIAGDARESSLVELCASAEVDAEEPLLMISARSADAKRLRAKVDRVLTGVAGRVIVYADPGELIGIVLLGRRHVRRARAAALEALRGSVDDLHAAVCLGPVVDDVRGGSYSLEQARLTLELAAARSTRSRIYDSDGSVVDRLVAENTSSASRARLVDELLGELIAHDFRRGTNLIDTLECWLRTGCNTAETARLLFLERQSMHNRLQRIFALIGGDPRGSGRLAGLAVALRALRQTPSKYHSA